MTFAYEKCMSPRLGNAASDTSGAAKLSLAWYDFPRSWSNRRFYQLVLWVIVSGMIRRAVTLEMMTSKITSPQL
jgi:hypothetical protein